MAPVGGTMHGVKSAKSGHTFICCIRNNLLKVAKNSGLHQCLKKTFKPLSLQVTDSLLAFPLIYDKNYFVAFYFSLFHMNIQNGTGKYNNGALFYLVEELQ